MSMANLHICGVTIIANMYRHVFEQHMLPSRIKLYIKDQILMFTV